MEQVTRGDVAVFLRKLEIEHSGALIAKIKSVASSVWTDAMDDGLVTSNPFLRQKSKAHVAKPKSALTARQYRLIVAAMPVGHRLTVRLLAETGLRVSEAQRLVDADLDGCVLTVRQSKSGRPRTVLVTPELAAELRGRLPLGVSYQALRTAWRRAAEGLPYTLHDLRHMHATIALANGASLAAVRDALGHSDIKTTSRYVHAASLDEVRQAVARGLA